MAVPKKKMSKAKTRMRRASAWKLTEPSRSLCPRCGDAKLPHDGRAMGGGRPAGTAPKPVGQGRSRRLTGQRRDRAGEEEGSVGPGLSGTRVPVGVEGTPPLEEKEQPVPTHDGGQQRRPGRRAAGTEPPLQPVRAEGQRTPQRV